VDSSTNADRVPRCRVHLTDEATIVERGEQVKVWFLQFADIWIRAKDHPDAIVEEEGVDSNASRCPPGTVWQRSTDLLLNLGTPLLCRVTRPLIEAFETLDYMTRERRSMRRHIDEQWFVVAGNYRMVKSREPESFSLARQEHERNTRTQQS
jgi:hypothetical protein